MTMAADTTREARNMQLDALRRLDGPNRLEMACRMSDDARSISEAGIPSASRMERGRGASGAPGDDGRSRPCPSGAGRSPGAGLMSQGELLARMVRGLDESGIPHMVVGSLASSFHAEPRTTQDIDIVIDPTRESLMRFVGRLPRPQLYTDPEAATEALERRTSFNIIEADTGWKVGLLIRRDRPFSREEMDRRIPVRLLEADTHVATAEDTIIAKLEWAKQGESDRQLRDVASILAVNHDTLDQPYLDRWIRSLELTDTWEQAQLLTAQR